MMICSSEAVNIAPHSRVKKSSYYPHASATIIFNMPISCFDTSGENFTFVFHITRRYYYFGNITLWRNDRVILLAELYRFPILTNSEENFPFLAHLSRMLTRWAYSIPMVRRPSVVVRRCQHLQTWISLQPVGQSWSNFMCSITGVGKKLYKVLGQIGSKLWFPWQQKFPIDL